MSFSSPYLLVALWYFHVNFLIQNSIKKGSFNINKNSIKLQHHSNYLYGSKSEIVHDRGKIVAEIHSWYLAVPQTHKLCMKTSIMFLLEDPFRSNKSAPFWDIIEWDIFPYTSCYHVQEFLPNCLSPLLSFYLVSMSPCFFEVSGFIVPNCTYDHTHHSTLHVEILKYFFSDCK